MMLCWAIPMSCFYLRETGINQQLLTTLLLFTILIDWIKSYIPGVKNFAIEDFQMLKAFILLHILSGKSYGFFE